MILDYLEFERYGRERITGGKTLAKIKRLTENQQRVYLNYHNELKKSLTYNASYDSDICIFDHTETSGSLHSFKSLRGVALDFMLFDPIKTSEFSQYDLSIFREFLSQYSSLTQKYCSYADRLISFLKFTDVMFSYEADDLSIVNNNVPVWNEYSPNYNSGTIEQKHFYDDFEKSLSTSTVLEVDGQLAYIFIYLNDRIHYLKYNKDYTIKTFEADLKLIITRYGNYDKIHYYVNRYLKEAFHFRKNYNKAWFYYLKQFKSDESLADWKEIVSIVCNSKNPIKLTGRDYYTIINKQNTTSFIITADNENLFCQKIEEYFDNFEKINGVDFLMHTLIKYAYGSIQDDVLNNIRIKYYDSPKIIKSANSYYHDLNKRKKDNVGELNSDLKSFSVSTRSIIVKSYPQIAYDILDYELSYVLRSLENELRNENGVAKIGESWISESFLFFQVSNAFSDEVVVRQGSPNWLGRQRFDIYFPKHNLAIEYQGDQHYKPVDFFGGQQAFEKIIALDNEKAAKAKKNNCKIIYVHPNYDFQDVLNEVLNELKR